MNKRPLNYSMDLDINSNQRSLTYDFWILLSVFCLSAFGIAMIYSASQSYDMALRQFIYFVLGFSFLILISFSNFRRMESIYLFCYWPGLILLFIVLFFSDSNNNTNRWIDLGIFTFQPSEIMRFLIPLSAAAFLSRKPDLKLTDFFIVLILTIIPTFLVLLQPDLGTAAIVLLSGVLPILLAGLPWLFVYLGAL